MDEAAGASSATIIPALRADQHYLLRDIRVIATPLPDGWWQLTDLAWREKGGYEPWIWSVSPAGHIYEGMVRRIDNQQCATGGDTGLTLRDLQIA
jgi:hypothetical protein